MILLCLAISIFANCYFRNCHARHILVYGILTDLIRTSFMTWAPMANDRMFTVTSELVQMVLCFRSLFD